MDVLTTIKYLRVSPRKANRVMKEIIGKPVDEALKTLQFLPHRSAQLIYNVLHSAKSNAVNNFQLAENNLIVAEGYTGQALIMKRVRPMSKGRAGRIQKKLSHISIRLKERS